MQQTHASIPVRWPVPSLSTLPPVGDSVESPTAASLRAAELTTAMCMSMRDSMTGLLGVTGSTHVSAGSSPPQFASAHPWPSSHSPGVALSAASTGQIVPDLGHQQQGQAHTGQGRVWSYGCSPVQDKGKNEEMPPLCLAPFQVQPYTWSCRTWVTRLPALMRCLTAH